MKIIKRIIEITLGSILFIVGFIFFLIVAVLTDIYEFITKNGKNTDSR